VSDVGLLSFVEFFFKPIGL